MSKYMLAAEEEAGGQCNVSLALSRFELLLTLEQSSAMLPLLLSMLVPAGSSGGEEDAATNTILEGVQRFHLAHGEQSAVPSRYQRSSLPEEAKRLLASSLTCDVAIYAAIVKANEQRLRDAAAVHRRFAHLNLTLPRISPRHGKSLG